MKGDYNEKKNESKQLLACRLFLATVLLLSGNSAFAQDFTTDDSVMTLTLPDKEGWEQVEDSHTWMTLSNGTDRITLLHYRNGEPLPASRLPIRTFPAPVKVSSRPETRSSSSPEVLQRMWILMRSKKLCRVQSSTSMIQKLQFRLLPPVLPALPRLIPALPPVKANHQILPARNLTPPATP